MSLHFTIYVIRPLGMRISLSIVRFEKQNKMWSKCFESLCAERNDDSVMKCVYAKWSVNTDWWKTLHSACGGAWIWFVFTQSSQPIFNIYFRFFFSLLFPSQSIAKPTTSVGPLPPTVVAWETTNHIYTFTLARASRWNHLVECIQWMISMTYYYYWCWSRLCRTKWNKQNTNTLFSWQIRSILRILSSSVVQRKIQCHLHSVNNNFSRFPSSRINWNISMSSSTRTHIVMVDRSIYGPIELDLNVQSWTE